MLKSANALVGAAIYREGATLDGIVSECEERGYRDGLVGIDRSNLLPAYMVDAYRRGHVKASSKIPTR